MSERYCIKEEYFEAEGVYTGAVCYRYICREWRLTYSDGTVEVVTQRVRK